MLAKKMLRDIKKHKTQFLSIFLMAFLGVFVFAGVGGESVGLEVNVNNYYNDTNLADGWIYSPNLDMNFIDDVNNLTPTTQSERQLVLDSIADFSNNPEIKLHFIENNTISKFYLMDGEPLNISDEDGVWLDKSFADAKNLKVGDNITFEFNGFKIKKEIKGIGYSPEYVYHASTSSVIPDFNKIGFAYMSYKAFPTDNIPYNVLNVKFTGSPEEYNNLLSDKLDGEYNSFVEQSEHSSVSQFSEEINQHKMMGDIFPVVFILIAMLILLTTMTRIIAHQRTQIGILKASGFTNKSIMIHYVSYGFWLVLIGSILGLIIGPVTLPQLFYPSMSSTYKLPSWNPAWSMDFVYVAVVMIIMSLLVSYFAVRSISKENPADTIKPKIPKISSSGLVEKIGFWKHLSFNSRWNYRDAKRNKFRALMTIIGVIGCTALLVSAFGMYDGMNDLKEWEFNQINHYDSKLVIDNDASLSEIDDVARDVDGDKIMESAIEIESDSAKKSGSLIALNHTDLITPTDYDWNKMEIGDDEVSISQKMADMLDISVGDTVKWHIIGSDKWIKTKIDKIHADPTSQGIVMSSDKLENLDLNYTPTSIVTEQHVDKNYSIIKTVNSMKDITSSWDELTESMWLLIYILIFFASLLAIVVLYNLGLLSFTEIEREIATLKVLGFKTGSLRKLLLTQNLWFTFAGFILGLPVGYYVLKMMWDSSGDSFYILPSISPMNFILTATITFTLSILVNLMFSRKIKKLNMVESLKSGE
ncbi:MULTISPECIES: ABC transporter permease [Methanobrevibacter]|uniref:Putative ABC transport system permease protein n=1 Tax=Methanobrevibacter gottschalkii DSM 11977 TaxID=1122229 RepID=A0A3N5C5B3_9EURY|nr:MULTISPECIES: ABC transporter permease [Methanobrevibacter]OEC98531.1 cell division protein FtsX [Methanobrevibacter sp. A27]RPF51511.1 putative ABC transport system permease protein [Methanobrevibacter gottschalkii DSM 11977]